MTDCDEGPAWRPSLSEVVATPGMPSFRAVYRWLRQFPEFPLGNVEACAGRKFLLHEMGIDVANKRGWIDFAGPRREVARLDERAGPRREVARLDERAGRTRPKKYRALPPEDVALRSRSSPSA